MNSVSIIGRLTRDPELRQTASGTDVCNLRLAVDRAGPKTDDGIGVGFFDVTLWGKTALVAAEHLSKGRQVGIEGELRWREWETDDGAKRQAVDVNGRNLTFVGSRDDSTSGGGESFAATDDDIPF